MSAQKVERMSPADEIALLRVELNDRAREAEWLKAHYDRHLRDAFSQIRSLKAAPRQSPAPSAPAPSASPRSGELPPARPGELQRLQFEIGLMREAETRYLDRIEELKEALALSEGAKT